MPLIDFKSISKYKGISNKFVIEANIDTSIKENGCIRQKWLNDVDNWISSHLSVEHDKMNELMLLHTDNIMPVIRFDGACRGNPSNVLGLGYIIKQQNKKDHTDEKTLYEGYCSYVTTNGTNNEAEYLSLIKGMELALDNNIKKVIIEGDSNLIINQMLGHYQVKADNLIPLYKQAKKLAVKFDFLHFVHIKREFNKEADKLANKALDEALNKANENEHENESKCPGCEPIFQENQLAHIGPNGCIKCDDY